MHFCQLWDGPEINARYPEIKLHKILGRHFNKRNTYIFSQEQFGYFQLLLVLAVITFNIYDFNGEVKIILP